MNKLTTLPDSFSQYNSLQGRDFRFNPLIDEEGSFSRLYYNRSSMKEIFNYLKERIGNL